MRYINKRVIALMLSLLMMVQLAPTAVFAVGGEPTISVVGGSASAGDTVEVDIVLSDNPGVVTVSLAVEFDENVLSLVQVQDQGALGTNMHNPELVSPYYLRWANNTQTTDFTYNGSVVTLIFQISDDAEFGEYPVSVSYSYEDCDIVNWKMEPVEFQLQQGVVTVSDAPAAATDLASFEYEKSGNELTITGYTGDAAKVIIADSYEIDGQACTVTAIGVEAFLENETVTSFTANAGLKVIDEAAFWGCVNLSEVVLNEDLETVGAEAFYNCESLLAVTVPGKQTQLDEVSFGYMKSGRKEVLVEGFQMTGYAGSTAEAYAAENDIPFVAIEENEIIANGTCGENVTWVLDSAGTLTISGTGVVNSDDPIWYDYHILKVVIEDGISGINTWAFSDLIYVTTVTLAEGVQTIADYAFSDCISLAEISIPDTLSFVGAGVFEGCSNLNFNSYENGLYLGSANNPYVLLVSLADRSVENYKIHEDTRVIGDAVFRNCSMTTFEIPDGVVSIGPAAFQNCYNLSNIMIPNSVLSIENAAFENCVNLSHVTLPERLLVIGDYAFFCSGLVDVNIPDRITSIGTETFALCYNLKEVFVGNSTFFISKDAFYCCDSLTGIWVDKNNPYFWSDDQGVLFDGDDLKRVPPALTGDYSIPEGITTVHSYAFESCINLSSVIIPESVELIEPYAFESAAIDSVTFLGRKTEFYDTSFDEDSDTVLIGYWQSWVHSYAEDYGLTFEPLLGFTGASVTLYHNLAVDFKAGRALFEEYGYRDPYVVFEFNGQTTTVTEYTVEDDKYVFPFRNIAPNQMNDTIRATIYATKNGELVTGEVREYSIADYCYGVLSYADDDYFAELRTLLVDMLHYGAAAQVYTGYKTDDLVDADLTAQQLAWGTNAAPALESILNTAYKTVDAPTAQWKGASLYLQDSVTLRLKLSAQSIDGLSAKIESGGVTWIIPAGRFENAGNGMYYVYFTGLNAGQMRQAVDMTICNGDVPVSNTARYSIESYAFEQKNSDITGLAELLQAMMKYGDSAYAYANGGQ